MGSVTLLAQGMVPDGMHERAQEFVDEARDRYDVIVEVHEFPEGTKTADEAAESIGCDVAQIASSLVFLVDSEPIVVVTSGANRVSEARLAQLRGASDARMANPEEVRSATGWSIGGVPPFCHDQVLPVYIDETLLEYDRVWAAAGTPECVFPIDPEQIVAAVDAQVARVTAD